MGKFWQRPKFPAAVALIASVLAQLWIISAGHWRNWPIWSDDYSRLAEGFLHGKLSLNFEPPRELSSLPDPYDYRQNQKWAWHDALLFNGHYYFYWGPVPSLLTAAFCLPLGISHPLFGDQYLTFPFMVGAVLLTAWLLLQIRARFFADQPIGGAVAAVLSLALGTPVLFTLARAAVYEAAITAGQFFLVAGLCAAWIGLKDRPRTLWLTISGICLAMSAGSRISLAPAIAVIALVTAWKIRRTPWAVVGMAVPLVLSAVLYGAYNYARFGSALDSGIHYQLATYNLHAMSRSDFSSPTHVLPNLMACLLTPPLKVNPFPYLMAGSGRYFASLFGMPKWYRNDAIIGLLWSQPLLLLGLAALWKPGSVGATSDDGSLMSWLTWSLLAGSVIGFAPALTILGTTMRYLLDAVPCGTILAAIGYWRLMERLRSYPRVSLNLWSAVRMLVAAECIMGLLLGISGYYGQFSLNNPALYRSLQHWLPLIKI